MVKPYIIATFVAVFIGQSFAWEDPAPPITSQTLVGVWEGIAGHQLYRMELFAGGNGYLAFMDRPADRQLSAIFRLTSAKVADGRVCSRRARSHAVSLRCLPTRSD
jgi:hypothetical protein